MKIVSVDVFKTAFEAENESGVSQRFIKGIPAIVIEEYVFMYYDGAVVFYVERDDKRYYSRIIRMIMAYCNLLYFNYNGLNPETLFYMITDKIWHVSAYIQNICTIYFPDDNNGIDMPRRLYAHANYYYDVTSHFTGRYAGLKYIAGQNKR